VSNLRKAFITLGSTQLCSMLFLINVLIFALPISSTHVVISGLTGSSLIYYTAESTAGNRLWFAEEMGMWAITPFLAILLSLLCHSCVKKHIMEHPDARKRVVMLLPWYITLVLWIMFTIVMTKNWKDLDSAGESRTDKIILIVLECAFPLIVLPLSRLSLLLRARTLNKSAELEQRLNFNTNIDVDNYAESAISNVSFNQ